MGPSGAGEMAAGHPTLREQAAVAAWCRMELLIQVTPDIPLWVGLREGGGLGRAKFRTRLNPSDPGLKAKPPAASARPPGNRVLWRRTERMTQGASHSAQHIASAQTPQGVIAGLGSAGASRVVVS